MQTDLSLDLIRKEDCALLRSWRNTDSIFKWSRQRDLLSKEDQEKWFESLQSNASVKMYAIKDITSIINPAPTVGVCGLSDIDFFNSRAEFSIYIAPEHQKKGFGEKALKLLLNHAFKNYPFKVIWGETFEGNHALRMFEKIGMKKEGTRRFFYYKDGKYLDTHLISITREEFYASECVNYSDATQHIDQSSNRVPTDQFLFV